MRILRTKLYVPPARPEWVPRPRLVERLEAGAFRKLTLVSAPAGSGKTTLVSSWVQGWDGSAVWLSLDEADNDPVRFVSYLLAGLQELGDGLIEDAQRLVDTPGDHDLQSLMAELGNGLSGLQQRLLLILDDYHSIEDMAIHEAIGFLLEALPASVHLVLVTRHDPAIHLSRLRGRGQMTEIRQADLRFSHEEAADLLQRATGLQLPSEEIVLLGERTEGWVTGLVLAALSMRGRDAAEVRAFIQEFSGRHHYVLDYITDEVLGRQPAWIREFLLHTCLLDQMCSDLCDALLQYTDGGDGGEWTASAEADSRRALAYLERHNLFVVPLDDERIWYRYHHLFADLLRARLEEAFAGRLPLLHRRAAVWFEAHQMEVEAVKHALATGRPAFAADVIERAILDLTTWSKLEVSTFRSWLSQLPSDTVRARPWLQLFASRTEYVGGDWRAAIRLLEGLESSLGVAGAHPDAEQIRHLVVADRASYAAVRGDVAEAIAYAREALDRTGDSDAIGQTRMRAILGVSYARAGQLSEAARAFAEAIETAHAAGMGFAAALFVCHLAEIQVAQGQLRQALNTSEEARRLGTVDGVPSSHTGFAGLPEARVLYEWNELAEAERVLVEGLRLLSSGQIPEHFGNMYALLGRVLWAQGRPAAALDATQRAVQLAQGGKIPRLVSQARAEQARLWLAHGRLDLAAQWADEFCQEPGAQYLRDLEELTLCRVWLAQGRAGSALEQLVDTLHSAQVDGRVGTVIEAKCLRALALQESGHPGEALAALGEALELGESAGYARVFVDAGPPMMELLRRAGSRGIRPGYVGHLIAAFGATHPAVALDDMGRPIPIQPLVEPLTARELEVLQLLAEGLPNREIARRLFVSLSTTKTHTRNVYGKLGVRSRGEAVDRARTLGILPDH